MANPELTQVGPTAVKEIAELARQAAVVKINKDQSSQRASAFVVLKSEVAPLP